MSRWTAALFACALAGVAACLPVHAADAVPAVTRFESGAAPNGKRLVLACAKGAAPMSCGLGQLADKEAAPRPSLQLQTLSSDRAYLFDLVRAAVESQGRDPQAVEGIPPTAADVAVLQQVAKNPSVCVGDENSADVMLACPTGKRFEDAVVMLFRGLCDACRFQPIVVRKVN